MARLLGVILSFSFAFLFMANVASAESITISKDSPLLDLAQRNFTTIEDLLALDRLGQIIVIEDEPAYLTYEVKKGDTLYRLAIEYETTVEEIMALNGLNSSLILIGQELIVSNNANKLAEVKDETNEIAMKSTNNEKSETTLSTEKESEEVTTVSGRQMIVTATAYTAECDGCSGITFTGVNLLNDRQKKVIAVDPNVIPLGSRVFVEGYGFATAEDIGSAIKGNRIDIHVPTKKEAYDWGVREVVITILDD